MQRKLWNYLRTGDNIIDGLLKLDSPLRGLAPDLEVVAAPQDWIPVIAVQVVHCAARAAQQDPFLAQLAQRTTDLNMEDRVIASIQAHDRCGWGSIGKHPSRRGDSVIMPVEGGIFLDIVEVVFTKQAHYSSGQGNINVNRVVLPVGSGDHVHLDDVGLRLRGYADAVVEFFPVGAYENEAFDAVGASLCAELPCGQY